MHDSPPLPLPHTFTHADVASVKELVKVCTQGAAVVMDRHLVALNRLWCAYEMWAFVNYIGIGAIKVGGGIRQRYSGGQGVRLGCAYKMWAFVHYVGIGAIKVWVGVERAA